MQDEYDSYVGPFLRLVESGKADAELVPYVHHIVFEYMGLNKTSQLEAAIESFANKFSVWYRTSWPDTFV